MVDIWLEPRKQMRSRPIDILIDWTAEDETLWCLSFWKCTLAGRLRCPGRNWQAAAHGASARQDPSKMIATLEADERRALIEQVATPPVFPADAIVFQHRMMVPCRLHLVLINLGCLVEGCLVEGSHKAWCRGVAPFPYSLYLRTSKSRKILAKTACSKDGQRPGPLPALCLAAAGGCREARRLGCPDASLSVTGPAWTVGCSL